MEKIYDMIVIGGGPAGLTAGIYGGRAKLDVLVIEKEEKGGQIKITSEVVNYPGIKEISGSELVDKIKEQAKSFKNEFIQDEVIDMELHGDIKVIKTKSGKEYKGLSVVIATGASPRKLNFPGEIEYSGRGVAYCATCDGEFFTGLDVFVIGGGFAAAEESMFLTKYAKKVHVIVREPEFTCARTIADKVLAHPKIDVRFNTEVLEATGDKFLRKILLKNNITNEIEEFSPEDGETFGIFIFVGYEPQSKIFKNHVEIDKQGFILTNEDLMTNVTGVYAVGDIRPKKLRQVVTAVSDGAIASSNIEKYVFDLREKLGLKKDEVEVQKENEVKEQMLDENLKEQLREVTKVFQNKIELAVIKGENLEETSEIIQMAEEIGSTNDKIQVKIYEKTDVQLREKGIDLEKLPAIAILNDKGEYSRIKYTTVPTGHELNSFILAMYNVSGPGQKINDSLVERISKIDKKLNIKIGISLNCTRCPETVQSTQRIAVENPNINVEVIDVFSHKEFKKKYDILSVPAMVINDKELRFGQLSLEEVLDILEKI
ncbi:FAD-dependent oxidoreductase [Fusobacterium perfoetens]|uniref:FAD-dependent oxidoreductase n=1 Tax=Fusobacterium perfoetens TaxID=852 RepID=UPI000484CE0B|nr:FAD-dependent oxidoreductase [Fusobacterium perfoetens]MCI6152551.1 FAD-dependent oxidoreductase [Fusobacterium perfoetens]MDY3237559.1 FAD-dependent oxidoreductase [Fusobacterium perfoetens]